MDDDALLRRRLERERLARQEAEAIIEQKSRELFTKSQELERLAAAERKARREAETLRDAFEVFTSRLDPDDIIGDLLEFLDLLVPHDSSVVYVLRGDELSPHDGKGRLRSAAGAEGVPAPSLLAEVLRAKRPYRRPGCRWRPASAPVGHHLRRKGVHGGAALGSRPRRRLSGLVDRLGR